MGYQTQMVGWCSYLFGVSEMWMIDDLCTSTISKGSALFRGHQTCLGSFRLVSNEQRNTQKVWNKLILKFHEAFFLHPRFSVSWILAQSSYITSDRCSRKSRGPTRATPLTLLGPYWTGNVTLSARYINQQSFTFRLGGWAFKCVLESEG